MSGFLPSEDDIHKNFDQDLDIFAELVQDIDANKNLPQESGSAINEAQSKNPTDDQEPPFGTVFGTHVIVHSNTIHSPLSEGSIFWITEHQIPLGHVEATFGPLMQRNYVVRLADAIVSQVVGPPANISLPPMGNRKFEENSMQQRSHLLNIAPPTLQNQLYQTQHFGFPQNAPRRTDAVFPHVGESSNQGGRGFYQNLNQQMQPQTHPMQSHHVFNAGQFSYPGIGGIGFYQNQPLRHDPNQQMQPQTQPHHVFNVGQFSYPGIGGIGFYQNQPLRHDPNQQMQPQTQPHHVFNAGQFSYPGIGGICFYQNQPLRHDPNQQMQPQTQPTRGRGSGGRGRGPQD